MAEASPTAIVYTPRAELRDIVKADLEALGKPGVVAPATRDACIEQLIQAPAAVLVVDWNVGSADVNQVLAAIRGHFHVETRPILLVIPELDERVIATATEYGVSQIHAGELKSETVRACLASLLTEDASTRQIREGLIRVATAREKGDWTIATPILQELWAKHAGSDRIAVELAENLIYEGQWDKAVELLTPFSETEPPHVRALHLIGRCRMHHGDYDGAIKFLERAKIINPHNVERLIDLGNAFLNDDQVDQAMVHFKGALTLDEDNKNAKIGKSQCHLLSGEINEALAMLKAISGPREMASIFNTAAVLAMRQGRHEQGMQLYRSALSAIGRDDKVAARLMFNMGLGYKRWQKPDKALACFQKSVELDPTYVKAAQHKDRLGKGGASAEADATDGGAFGLDEETIGAARKHGQPATVKDADGSHPEEDFDVADGAAAKRTK